MCSISDIKSEGEKLFVPIEIGGGIENSVIRVKKLAKKKESGCLNSLSHPVAMNAYFCSLLSLSFFKMQNTSVDQREHARHYIPASDADIDAMLKTVGKASLDELFSHIPADVKFEDGVALPEELGYDDLYTRLEEISKMKLMHNFGNCIHGYPHPCL